MVDVDGLSYCRFLCQLAQQQEQFQPDQMKSLKYSRIFIEKKNNELFSNAFLRRIEILSLMARISGASSNISRTGHNFRYQSNEIIYQENFTNIFSFFFFSKLITFHSSFWSQSNHEPNSHCEHLDTRYLEYLTTNPNDDVSHSLKPDTYSLCVCVWMCFFLIWLRHGIL